MGPAANLVLATFIIDYNFSASNIYVYIGYLQIFANIFYIAILFSEIGYGFFNGLIMSRQYPMFEPVPIRFMVPDDLFTDNYKDVDKIFYLWELVFGHKMLQLYAESIVGTAMLFHPITFVFSGYYWGQTGLRIFFGLFYVFFPEFNVPPI